MVRFFSKDQLHEEVYAVVDASTKVKVVLLLGRGHPTHVKLESSTWDNFRRAICYGCCDKNTIDWGYLCDEGTCEREVTPS